MNYLRNAWYQAGWSDEVNSDGMLARTILEIPIVFFRDRAGVLHALADRCAHRFAPLSRGRVSGDVIQCGYHGLGFDGAGQCALNPHGPIPKSVRVQSYPVLERHKAIWVWTGVAERADEQIIPSLPFIDAMPITADVRGYMHTRANYQLLTDNILDLSHTNYLHAQSIGGLSPGVTMSVREVDDKVIVRWLDGNAEPNLIQKALMSGVALVDNWVEVQWSAPAVMVLDAGAVPAGTNSKPEDHTLGVHSMTPETASTTHYFFSFARGRDLDNVELTSASRKLITKAFLEEDKPMIEAQQARMPNPDLWQCKPALLSIDKAAVRARRKLERLIEHERSPLTQAPLATAFEPTAG